MSCLYLTLGITLLCIFSTNDPEINQIIPRSQWRQQPLDDYLPLLCIFLAYQLHCSSLDFLGSQNSQPQALISTSGVPILFDDSCGHSFLVFCPTLIAILPINFMHSDSGNKTQLAIVLRLQNGQQMRLTTIISIQKKQRLYPDLRALRIMTWEVLQLLWMTRSTGVNGLIWVRKNIIKGRKSKANS